MNTQHTPEPWALRKLFEEPIMVPFPETNEEAYTNEYAVHGIDDRVIACVEYFTDTNHKGWGHNETIEKWEANAERIVACVNACAGMIDPAKEIAELRAEIARLKNPPSAPTCDELDYDSRS